MHRWLLIPFALLGAATSGAQSRDSTATQPVDTLALLRKKAEEGDAGMQATLGVAYSTGKWGLRDDSAAVFWLRRAAEQGHALAQYVLGDMYRKGVGVPRNEGEAFAQMRAAAERGYVPAQWDLSLMYARGVGVRPDMAEAVRWCRKAAEQGHPHAQFNMGQIYGHGAGVPRDEVESVRWHRLAAEYALPGAQFQLAQHYAAGTGGLDVDRVQAYMWLTLAAPQVRDDPNDRRLVENLRRALESKMSAEDIAEARAMASDWRPSRKPLNFQWPPDGSGGPLIGGPP